jgi:(2Fe-2S) ferredoxin
MKFKKHIFICTNEREDKSRKCCGEGRGMELVKLFKKNLKDRQMNVDIRAQRAGCIDACDFGPSLVIYPEGVFYGAVTPADVDEIIESHLINQTPVERLVIDFNK